MKIIAKEPDLKVYWNTFSALTAYNANDLVSPKYFPTFDVSIYYNDILLKEYKKLENKREKTIQMVPSVPPSKNLGTGVNLARKLNINKNLKKVIENYFEYTFLDNFNKYKELNNQPGFYSNLDFNITFNSEEPSYMSFSIEYPRIESENLYSLFYKVYRSNDLYSSKFLIDNSIFEELQIYSLLIFPKSANYNLAYSFTEDIKSNWLNSVNNLKLLTVPFEDIGVIEEVKNIELEVFPLTKLQSNIVKIMKEFVTKDELLSILKEKYINQKLDYTIFVNQNDTFFQGNLYLFNNLNFQNLSWPKEEKNINGIFYKNFFPISNYLEEKTIISEFNKIQPDILVTIPNVDLGYYYNNNYINIENDILHFSHNSIIKIEILNVEKNNQDIVLHIEFLTNLNQDDNIYATSDNLSFEQKYMKLYENNMKLAVLFSYKYSSNDLDIFSNQANAPIENIIFKELPFQVIIKSY